MARLAEVRQRHGLTIPELARRARVTPRTVREAEGGQRVPYRTSAGKIAAALGVEPEEIDEFTRWRQPATRRWRGES